MSIVMKGVEKTYGEGPNAVRALRSTDLFVPQGELLVILGPSGSGKTTMLNLLGGLDEPTAGIVEVNGHRLDLLDLDQLVDFRRSTVGFVFQFFNLIPTLTAAENVELVAELTDGDHRERTKEALNDVGLLERAHHFPSQLSGGEQQRVAIARALVKQPPVLLCDEPTGELDFETGRVILSLLQRLSGDQSRTVLLVTHNAAIGEMADRVIRLRSGQVVDDHTVAQPVEAEELIW